jgi:hypothetical protein
MPPLSEGDLESLASGLLGAVHVQHGDGTPVVYGTRVKARVEGGVVVICIYDEQYKLLRGIPADEAIELRPGGAASVLVVSDDVESDPGPTTVTRGV